MDERQTRAQAIRPRLSRKFTGTALVAATIAGWISLFAAYAFFRATAGESRPGGPENQAKPAPGPSETAGDPNAPKRSIFETIFGSSVADYDLCRKVLRCDRQMRGFPDPAKKCGEFVLALEQKTPQHLPELRLCVSEQSCEDLDFASCLEQIATAVKEARGQDDHSPATNTD